MTSTLISLILSLSAIMLYEARPSTLSEAQPGTTSYDFRIIRNFSLTCDEMQADVGAQVRRVQLTDDQKLFILKSKGGVITPTFMAVDMDAALKHFPNLLELPQQVSSDSRGVNTLNAIVATSRTKADIADYLKTHQSHLEPPHDSADHKEDDESHTKDKQPYSLHTDSREQIIQLFEQLIHKRGVSARHTRDTQKSGNGGEVEETSSTRKGGNKPVEKPVVSPQEVGMAPVVVADTGASTVNEYCQPRKTLVDGFYRMCTTCAATTTLPADRWPRIINEALCTTNDPNCLIVEGEPHGVCKQRIVTMTMLEQSPGYCTLALLNGETVIVDTWEPYTQSVRVGCECTIHQNSVFAEFL